MQNVLAIIVTAISVPGILAFLWKIHSWRWNRLASQYGTTTDQTTNNSEQKLQQIMLFGSGSAFNSYRGMVTVGVTDRGLSFKLLPPFSFFHPRLFIPSKEYQISPSWWYLNCESFKITTSSVPDIEVIIDADLKSWIESQTNDIHVKTNPENAASRTTTGSTVFESL